MNDAQKVALADLLDAHDSTDTDIQNVSDSGAYGEVWVTFYSQMIRGVETYQILKDGEVDA